MSKKKQKDDPKPKLKRSDYEEQLCRLQAELCTLQAWVKAKGLRAIVIFEGRDGAGKGGTIRAITERVSPRVFRAVALPAPSDREKSQMYMQRYMQHFPAAGEIVIFDRSWYNRAGVEHVMGFCSDDQYQRFLELCPEFERYVVEGGIILLKYWLEVSNEEQERRFLARIEDPLRQWKLSDGLALAVPLVRLLACKRRDAQGNRHETRPVAHSSFGRQKASPPQLHFAPAQPDSLQEASERENRTARAV
jgi:polyphosphate kinase 2